MIKSPLQSFSFFNERRIAEGGFEKNRRNAQAAAMLGGVMFLFDKIYLIIVFFVFLFTVYIIKNIHKNKYSKITIPMVFIFSILFCIMMIPSVDYFDLTKDPNIPMEIKLRAMAEIHVKSLGYNKSEFDVFIVANDSVRIVYFIPKEFYDNNKIIRVRLDKTYKVLGFEEWNIKKAM